MKLGKYIYFGVFLALCMVIPQFVGAEVVEKIVAVVNEDPITTYDLEKMIARNEEGKRLREGLPEAMRPKEPADPNKVALEDCINERLLEQEMKKFKIDVTEDDINKAINNVLQRNKMTEEDLKKEITKKGTSYSSYKEQLKTQLKRIKFMGRVIAPRVKVTNSDLDEFFAKNSDKFSRFQSVEMAQIIIPLSPGADSAEQEQANSLAKDVRKKAKGGNFESLGKKYSVNPDTAVKSVYQVNMLAPQLASVIADLKPGEISEPVRSTMGLHVIKLYERKTLAGEEYKALREQIRERVFEVKIEESMIEYLDEVKERSHIEIKA